MKTKIKFKQLALVAPLMELGISLPEGMILSEYGLKNVSLIINHCPAFVDKKTKKSLVKSCLTDEGLKFLRASYNKKYLNLIGNTLLPGTVSIYSAKTGLEKLDATDMKAKSSQAFLATIHEVLLLFQEKFQDLLNTLGDYHFQKMKLKARINETNFVRNSFSNRDVNNMKELQDSFIETTKPTIQKLLPDVVIRQMESLGSDLDLLAAYNQGLWHDIYWHFPKAVRVNPVFIANSTEATFCGMSLGSTETQGGRAGMEDRHLISKNMIAVFDGHGGANTAATLVTKFRELSQQNPNPSKGQLIDMFEDINKQFTDPEESSGSTAVTMTLTDDGRCRFANVGDSRAVVIHQGASCTRVTYDHTGAEAKEQARLKSVKVKVTRHLEQYTDSDYSLLTRVEKHYSFSRHLGFNQDNAVICTPEITDYSVQPTDRAVVLATDGLWNVMSDAEVAGFITHHLEKEETAETIAKALAKEAMERDSDDNTTVIICLNKKSGPFAPFSKESDGINFSKMKMVFEMCENGNLVGLLPIIKDTDIKLNMVNENKLPPLLIAAQANHIDIVKALLKESINPNATDDNDWTFFHFLLDNISALADQEAQEMAIENIFSKLPLKDVLMSIGYENIVEFIDDHFFSPVDQFIKAKINIILGNESRMLTDGK